MMNSTKFQLIYEDIMNGVITESAYHSLQDELFAVWPFAMAKFERGFATIFGGNEPGLPDYDPASLHVTAIDEGTDRPGFHFTYSIADVYATTLIHPFNAALNLHKAGRNPLETYIDELGKMTDPDLYFEFFMYLKSKRNDSNNISHDYSKGGQVRKNTTIGWEGTGYINFDLSQFGGPGRKASKLKLCSIDIDLGPNGKSLLGKLKDFDAKAFTEEKLWSALGGALMSPLKHIKREKRDRVKAALPAFSYDNAWKDVITKIEWQNFKIEHSEANLEDNYTTKNSKSSPVNLNPNVPNPKSINIVSKNDKELIRIFGKDWPKKVTYFAESKIQNGDQLRPDISDSNCWSPVVSDKVKFGDPVTSSDDLVGGHLEVLLTDKPEEVYKIYDFIIDIKEWKKDPAKSDKLWNNNPVDPFVVVQIRGKSVGNILVYRMTKAEFERIEQPAVKYVNNILKKLS